MTDMRYLENHNEEEPGGWKDLIVGIIGMLAVVCAFAICWKVLPGAQTPDDILQIDPPHAHHYHPGTHQMTFIDQGADK